MRIITEPKELIARYVSRNAGHVVGAENYVAVALVNDDDELVAGVVFNGFNHPEILMHIACEVITPAFVAAIIYYPFVQLGCERVTGVIDRDNFKSRRFAQHLGAIFECEVVDDSGRWAIYGLLRKHAAKWLTKRNLEKLERLAA